MTSADLRLAAPAVAAWIVVGLALLVPLSVTVVLICCLVTGAMWTGVIASRRRSAIALALAAVCGLAAMAGLACAIRVGIAESAPVRDASGRPLVVVQVVGDPQFAASAPLVRLPVRVLSVNGNPQRPVDAVVSATTSVLPETIPGQRLALRVRVRPPPGGPGNRLVVARLVAQSEPTIVREAPVWQRWAGTVRERLRAIAARALGPRAAGLMPGLVLGDTSSLDPQLRDNFRAAGLTHLVAVSGANFGIVCGAVVLAARMLGASTRVIVVVGLLAMVGFVILVRPTDSVLRAAVMGGIGLVGALAARRAQALPALGVAVIVVLLFWPELALAPGFALSVAATLGLVLWAAPIRQRLQRWGMPEALAVLLAMTLAAQLLTTPLVIAISDQISIVSLPANLLVAPVVGVIALLGTAAAVVGGLGPAGGVGAVLAELLTRATAPEIWWLITCADTLGGHGWSAPQVPGWQAATVFVMIGVFGWWAAHQRSAHQRSP